MRSKTEHAVLSAIITDEKQFTDVSGVVYPDMFTDWRKEVALHVWSKYGDFEPVDLLTIRAALRDGQHPEAHANGLYKNPTRNGLQFAIELQDIYHREQEEAHLTQAIADLATEKQYTEVITELDAKRTMMLSRIAPATKDQNLYVETAHQIRNGKQKGIPTGFGKLDMLIGGWVPGSYTGLAARPGMGKTLVLCWMIIAALRDGQKVVFFSFEMGADEILEMIACLMIGLNPDDLLEMDATKREKVAQQVEQLYEADLIVYDTATHSDYCEEVVQTVRRLQAKDLCTIWFQDYLQLSKTYAAGKEYDKLNEISETYRTCIQKTKIPGIAAIQLNRDLEKRGDKRPVESDLRGSGKLEQDLKTILALYRPAVYGIEEDETGLPLQFLTELIVRKARGRGRAKNKTIELWFNPESASFSETEPDMYPDIPDTQYSNSISPAYAQDTDEDLPF